jgi:hypothetical protein
LKLGLSKPRSKRDKEDFRSFLLAPVLTQKRWPGDPETTCLEPTMLWSMPGSCPYEYIKGFSTTKSWIPSFSETQQISEFAAGFHFQRKHRENSGQVNSLFLHKMW